MTKIIAQNFSNLYSIISYLIDDTADGSTSLHGLDGLCHAARLSHCLVADAVIEVEAASGQRVQVVQLHCLMSLSLFVIYD